MSFLLSHAVVRLCNWQRSNVLADWTKNPGQTADFRKPARTKAKKEDVSEETRTYGNPNLNQCFASFLLKILMHTTPLSTLISSCSLNHHLYADDTQLFLSFLPTHFESSIDHLHDALDQISSWMTANLRTLNSFCYQILIISPFTNFNT